MIHFFVFMIFYSSFLLLSEHQEELKYTSLILSIISLMLFIKEMVQKEKKKQIMIAEESESLSLENCEQMIGRYITHYEGYHAFLKNYATVYFEDLEMNEKMGYFKKTAVLEKIKNKNTLLRVYYKKTIIIHIEEYKEGK